MINSLWIIVSHDGEVYRSARGEWRVFAHGWTNTTKGPAVFASSHEAQEFLDRLLAVEGEEFEDPPRVVGFVKF